MIPSKLTDPIPKHTDPIVIILTAITIVAVSVVIYFSW